MAKDTLSALIDGECSPGELDRFLDEFEHSAELRQSWSRLCLTRDVTGGVRINKARPCICADVMARLDARPPAVVPGARVVPLWHERVRGYWKPLAGLAVAASLAAVVVTLNTTERGPAGGQGGGFAPQVSSPVSLPVTAPRRPRELRVVSVSAEDVQRAAFEDDLRRYLIEHSNTLADRGMGATLPYARFTAHSADAPIETTPAAGEQP